MKLFIIFLSAVLLFGCIGAPAEQPTAPAEPSGSAPVYESTEDQTPEVPKEPEEMSNPEPEPLTSLKHEEIVYASGPWDIHGTLYDNKAGTVKKVIVLVPMLGEARDSYPITFVERLHDAFPDALVLAIDPRGHGESTNLGNWHSFEMLEFKDMKTDILKIKNHLQSDYPALTELYVIGASIGSTSAINAAAQDKEITKVVMLSPGMEYRGVDITDALEDYLHDVLLVATTGDTYSAQSITDIESMASGPEMEKKLYSGSEHGTDMFAATDGASDSLENIIIDFFR